MVGVGGVGEKAWNYVGIEEGMSVSRRYTRDGTGRIQRGQEVVMPVGEVSENKYLSPCGPAICTPHPTILSSTQTTVVAALSPFLPLSLPPLSAHVLLQGGRWQRGTRGS